MIDSCARDLIQAFTWTGARDGKTKIHVKEGKAGGVLEVPASAIADFPYVVVNKWWYPFILVDVDEPPHGDKAEGLDPGFYANLDLPLPNLVTLTSRGFHVLYALEYPLARNGKGMPFYRYVRMTYNAALNADFSCATTAATRNPFFKGADAVCFGAWKRPLAKMDIPFRGSRPGFRVHSTAYVVGNRNTATFLFLLATHKASPATDFDRLIECAEAYQAQQVFPPLSRAENSGIVTSILRNASRYSLGNPNRGLLGLPPRTEFMPLQDFLTWKAERQGKGAAYATEARMLRCRENVAAAAQQLHSASVPVTVSAVARLAGVDRKTARKILAE